MGPRNVQERAEPVDFFLERVAQFRSTIQPCSANTLAQCAHEAFGRLHTNIGSNECFLQLIP